MTQTSKVRFIGPDPCIVQGLACRRKAKAALYPACEICSVPGILSCRRLKATPIAIPTAGANYISLYEIETDNIGALMAEMGRRSATGEQTPTDSLDKTGAVLWIYEDMGMAG